MPKVLAICGSLRAGSYNRALMNALPGLAPAAMTFEEAPSFIDMPHYNADLQNSTGIPGSVDAFAKAVRAADGVIIVTPEYNWTIPGALKNALDWVSRIKDQPFNQKPVAIQSATGGPLGGSRMQCN
jgi:chromate reductase, NAD(P)H dehydrogenase (quinone)